MEASLTEITKENYILTLFLLLPSSIPAFAHAGMMDRLIEHAVSMEACCTTIIAVQLVLLILFMVIFKHSHLNSFIHSAAETIAGTRFISIFLFWILFAFCLTPYLGLLTSGMFLAGLVPLFLSLVFLILIFFRKPRSLVNKPSCHYLLIHFSLQQTIGYFVYLSVYDTDFIRNLFRYTDDEYQSAIYIYPNIKGITFCGDFFMELLLAFSLAFIVNCIFEIASLKKSRNKTTVS